MSSSGMPQESTFIMPEDHDVIAAKELEKEAPGHHEVEQWKMNVVETISRIPVNSSRRRLSSAQTR